MKKRVGTLVVPKGDKRYDRQRAEELEGVWYSKGERVVCPVHESWADFDPTSPGYEKGYIVVSAP